MRDLKHRTAEVIGWTENGESVEVCRRSQVVAILSPVKRPGKVARPDFAGRLQEIYGNNVLATTATDLLSADRGDT